MFRAIYRRIATFVISDMRSHPATAQGTANVASLKLLADFNRGIASRMIQNHSTAMRSIAMA